MTIPDTHAPFAPSGLARVVACPGSYNMIRAARAAGKALNEDDTDDSLEGTAAHEVAVRLARDGECMPIGSLTSNGIAVTEEMLEGAEMWAEAVSKYPSGQFETLVKCPAVHHDCWGTPDYQYGPSAGVLYIPDYKFGHRYVSPVMNWQLIAYASGVMPEYYPTIRVVLQIVQPRSYHRDGPVREWRIDGDRLREHINTLRIAVAEAVSADARCVTGPQCYKCPARLACEAALSMEQDALYLSGSTVPLDVSVEAKAVRLRQTRRAADHLKQMEDGLVEDLTATVRRGVNVPGFTLQASAGREVWVKPVEEVIALGAVLGVDLSKPGCKTPNQARKAGLSPDIVKAYADRPSGSVSLVEDDGARIASVFKKGV